MKVRNGIGKRERERERESARASKRERERERERARWRCREKEKRERSATAPHTRCCGRILSLVLLSASLSAWMRAQLAVCLRKVTCEVPSVRARTHMYIYIYPRIIHGIGIIPPAGATKRGRTNLQATRSWQDMLCMLRAPWNPCICLPRTPCTCRRWAPCNRRCMNSLLWRLLLSFRERICSTVPRLLRHGLELPLEFHGPSYRAAFPNLSCLR